MFNFGGRRPMFISLDRIDASEHGKDVIEIINKIPAGRYTTSAFTFTDMDNDHWNDVEMYLFLEHRSQMLHSYVKHGLKRYLK